MAKCFHVFLRACKSCEYIVVVVFSFFFISFTRFLFFIIEPDLCKRIYGPNLYGIKLIRSCHQSSTNSKSAASSRRRKSKYSANPSHSQSSTASTVRLRASAKKAALPVDAAALKTRQDIQLEELLLKQKKDNFELETELAKAEEEEKVYSNYEEQYPSTPSS